MLREGSLAQVVQQVKSCSAIAVNKARGSKGQLWQAGDHDTHGRDGSPQARSALFQIKTGGGDCISVMSHDVSACFRW